MKKILMTLVLLSLSAFAAEQISADSKVEKGTKKHHNMSKAQHDEAKAVCLQENPALEKDKKGLIACIKGKVIK